MQNVETELTFSGKKETKLSPGTNLGKTVYLLYLHILATERIGIDYCKARPALNSMISLSIKKWCDWLLHTYSMHGAF